MAHRRYAGTVPTTGLAEFPISVMTVTPKRDVFASGVETELVEKLDEAITVDAAGAAPAGLVELDFTPGGDPLGETPAGAAVIEVWTAANKTGTQFTLIGPDADFGEPALRQCRVHPDRPWLDFDPAQIADGSIVTVYISYWYSHTLTTAWWRSKVEQEIAAAQTQIGGAAAGDRSGTATAGENVVRGLGYIDGAGAARQFSDPSDRGQTLALIWFEQAWSTGQTATYFLVKLVAKLAGVTTPIGQDLYAGRNAAYTWIGDESANALINGDWRGFVGRSYDGENVEVQLIGPNQGKVS